MPPGAVSGSSLGNDVAAILAGQQQRPNSGPLPVAVEQAMAAQGMDMVAPFAPGRPFTPYFEVGTDPRAFDYLPGYNLVTRPRSVESRMSFDTIREIYRVYDVARLCVEHRIDEVSGMELTFAPMKGVTEDVDWAIDRAERLMRKPDGTTPFQMWQSSFLEDVLKYDAGSLNIGRLRNGTPTALEVVDGTTILPLLNVSGRRPKGAAPAFTQIIHGLPGVWLFEDSFIYFPLRQQSNSPYGLSPIEWIILNANTDLRFQYHFLAYFTQGTLPAGFMEAPPDFSHPDNIKTLQSTWDSVMEGDAAKKHQIRWVPTGSKFTPFHAEGFDHTFPEWMLKKTCAAHKVKPTALGFVDDVNRAQGDVQQDVQAQIGRRPLLKYLATIYTTYLQDVHGLPIVAQYPDDGEKEDLLQQAQADKIDIEAGVISADERRVKLGHKVDPSNPVPRIMATRTGIVPISSIIALGGKNLDLETMAPKPGTISYVEDEPQPAALSGQENKVTDMVGATKRPQPGTTAPTPPMGQAAAPSGHAGPKPGQDGPPSGQHTAPPEVSGPVAKELRAFSRFAKSRTDRPWRDFAFTDAAPFIAELLNTAGRSDPATAATLAQSLLRETAP